MEAWLAPLSKAIISIETKLETHDESFEDIKRRLGVLEYALVHSEIDEKVKSAVSTEMKLVVDLMPGQIEQTVEDKIAATHEDKITKIIATNEEHTTRLIDQFLKHSIAVHKGNRSSENRTFMDYNLAGQAIPYNTDLSFRRRWQFHDGTLATRHIFQNPFSMVTLVASLMALLRAVTYQGKSILKNCNSFVELEFGNKFHKECVKWVL